MKFPCPLCSLRVVEVSGSCCWQRRRAKQEIETQGKIGFDAAITKTLCRPPNPFPAQLTRLFGGQLIGKRKRGRGSGFAVPWNQDGEFHRRAKEWHVCVHVMEYEPSLYPGQWAGRNNRRADIPLSHPLTKGAYQTWLLTLYTTLARNSRKPRTVIKP